jgi:signal transduction histidine kinase
VANEGYANSPEALRADVRLVLELDDALPEILAGPVQVQQVVLNLVRNGIDAVRAVDGPRRQITIRTGRDGEDGLAVAVEDTGAGIAPADQNQVFEQFFSTKQDGMGMGLPISRTIIEAHGGRLWFATTPGRGTTFHFALAIE